jgi:hypothetical protein
MGCGGVRGGAALARCIAALDKLKEGAVVLGKVLDSKDSNYGFNALTECWASQP